MALSIDISFRTADGFQLTFNNTDAVGTLTWEFNRAADFASDDTIIATSANVGTGAGITNITGLPGDTPFYIRARINVGTTVYAYSNVLLAATLTSAQVTTYAGFSHDKAMLVVPAPIMGIGGSGGAGSTRLIRPGFPLTNLLLDDPQATFQAYGIDTNSAPIITWQTSGELIDVIAMLGTLIADGATWRVRSTDVSGNFAAAGATDSGTMTMRCSPTLGRRAYYHALYQLPTPTQNRFWRLDINAIGEHFLARSLVAGLARASVNPSTGYGFESNDLGTATRTRFGGLDRVTGWRGRTIDFSMSWLNEAEFQTKWAPIPTLVGRGVSVLSIVNSKRNVWLNDRIGFGPLTSIRGENMRASKFQQSVTQDSIY